MPTRYPLPRRTILRRTLPMATSLICLILFLRSLNDVHNDGTAVTVVHVAPPPAPVTVTETQTMTRWVERKARSNTHHSRSNPELGKHTYRTDGLLEVNPNGAHPIYELVRDAQGRWDKKLERASRTLKQAVKEYKRRYKRAPPRGFDDWCVFYFG